MSEFTGLREFSRRPVELVGCCRASCTFRYLTN